MKFRDRIPMTGYEEKIMKQIENKTPGVKFTEEEYQVLKSLQDRWWDSLKTPEWVYSLLGLILFLVSGVFWWLVFWVLGI